MNAQASGGPPAPSFSDPRFLKQLTELRRVDNSTNVFYLLRAWGIIAVTIAATISFWHMRSAALSALWDVPVALLAIVIIGACQHQLAGAVHESAHHTLFANRLLNELVSDWFCAFPLFTTTYQYRLNHLAHHQFVNDPSRDPDFPQLRLSGHKFEFPMSKAHFLVILLKQLWIPRLVKYAGVRAWCDSLGFNDNPYKRRPSRLSWVAPGATLAYTLGLLAWLPVIVSRGDRQLLTWGPALAWLSVVAFLGLMPAAWYPQARVRPVFALRTIEMMRATFTMLTLSSVAWISLLWDRAAFLHAAVLWIFPMSTTFALFMILRQLIQHANTDRGLLSNSRVFLVNPFINFAVFPLGQGYHLPHHMFAMVPHHRLKRLHELLQRHVEYRERAVVAEGYFLPRTRPPRRPTAVETVGPEYAPRHGQVLCIDRTVLDGDEVEGRDELLELPHARSQGSGSEHGTMVRTSRG